MKMTLHIGLQTNAEQKRRLLALQQLFAAVCNTLAPTVRMHRCWNRVVLHHMTYKSLREQFPTLGSQMVCNAIYAVCRASRLVYQGSNSPYNVAHWGEKPLPLLRFAETGPVYFDRHTLSLKNQMLSLYTPDGRTRFQLTLNPADEMAFHQQKLREIVLSSCSDAEFELCFTLENTNEVQSLPVLSPASHLPDYLAVEEESTAV